MGFLAELWLPILLSSVLIFIAMVARRSVSK